MIKRERSVTGEKKPPKEEERKTKKPDQGKHFTKAFFTKGKNATSSPGNPCRGVKSAVREGRDGAGGMENAPYGFSRDLV